MEPHLFRYVWRHSRREQIVILLIILVSLPFYWISLDVPKRIVNDAIQGHAFKHAHEALLFHGVIALPDFLGGRTLLEVPGISLGQMSYLFALSGIYFLLVLVNGAFKYAINIRKGILGEAMLKRMRFDLFALLLRFRPEDVRAVKPAEVASMIKDEVEPIGSFIGDAFIQPVFLGTQALTALGFILMQNFWLGFVALAIVLVQAVVIPYLRREQIRLGRERQLASRRLAGRIGEIVDGAEAVHIHGTSEFSEADIHQRLMGLYRIRVALFRRKFSVKYLNNLLAQLTPFFFYAIGGYFALHKTLDIGQLVAVIAAYRDLPPPIKELIDWDQQRNDVTVKYEQIVAQFSPDVLLPDKALVGTAAPPPPDTPVVIEGLRVTGGRGNVYLDRTDLTIDRPAHVALIGSTGSGRDMLARVLARQITDFQGTVKIGETPLANISDKVAARFLAYVGVQPFLFPGTIRANVAYSILTKPPPGREKGTWVPRDWVDYAAAGVHDLEGLDRAIIAALAVSKADDQLYRFGILGRLGSDADASLPGRLVDARRVVRARLEEKGYVRLVQPFDPDSYNASATVARNLLFGVSVGDKLQLADLAHDRYARLILEDEGLIEPLITIGLKIAQTTLETFADLPRDHPLRERYSFIPEEEIDAFAKILDAAAPPGGRLRLGEDQRARVLNLALSYVERIHRLELLDEAFQQQIVAARRSFRRRLPDDYRGEIEFFDPHRYNTAASVLDNLLFGRVDHSIGNADQKVSAIVRETIEELDLLVPIYRLGLEYEVGVGGSQLFAAMRTAIDLARCLIKHPDILIVHNPVYGSSEMLDVLANIRQAMAGRTLIITLPEEAQTRGFDRIIQFDDERIIGDLGSANGRFGDRSTLPNPGAAPANLDWVELI